MCSALTSSDGFCCRDGCTHVLALCSRPYTTGPAWGRYLTRALHSAIKYWLLNPVSTDIDWMGCCHQCAYTRSNDEQ
jgi:hypothetical protein